MKTNELIKTAGKAVNKIGFSIKKKSPEILALTGVVGVVVGTVMACKATTKASEVAAATKKTLDEIEEAAANGVTKAGSEYTEEDKQKDLVIAYVNAGVAYAKLYAPAVITCTSSLVCLMTSNRILKKRNAAITAAYMTLDKTFKDYRGRVIDRFGEQIEKEIRYNIKAKEVETTVVDENGVEKNVKEVKNVADKDWNPANYSMYARLFDESNPGWMKDPEQTRFYLKALQTQANDRLKARGHLFLNEVYEMLRMPLTDYGQVVGWVFDLKNPIGDNFVDFGIIDVWKESDTDLCDDYIDGFILEFNVVGNITGDLATHQYY